MIDYENLLNNLKEEIKLAKDQCRAFQSPSYHNSYADGYDTGYYDGLIWTLKTMEKKSD